MKQGYTEEEKATIINDICEDVIDNKKSFNQAVKDSPISLVSFYKWIVSNNEFEKIYKYAREIRSDILFEEIIDIADNTEIGTVTTEKPTGVEIRTGDMEGHRRLQIDARKWVAARMNPKKYGDKLDLTSDGDKMNNTPKILVVKSEFKISESEEELDTER